MHGYGIVPVSVFQIFERHSYSVQKGKLRAVMCDEASLTMEAEIVEMQGVGLSLFLGDVCAQICTRAHGEENDSDAQLRNDYVLFCCFVLVELANND